MLGFCQAVRRSKSGGRYWGGGRGRIIQTMGSRTGSRVIVRALCCPRRTQQGNSSPTAVGGASRVPPKSKPPSHRNRPNMRRGDAWGEREGGRRGEPASASGQTGRGLFQEKGEQVRKGGSDKAASGRGRLRRSCAPLGLTQKRKTFAFPLLHLFNGLLIYCLHL